MITDMLKTGSVLSGTIEKGPLRQNDAAGSGEDFSAVLSQVTGLDERGTDSGIREKTVENQNTGENRNTQSTRLSHEQRAPEDSAGKTQARHVKPDEAGKASSGDPLPPRTGQAVGEARHRTRFMRLSEKLAGMNARQKVDGDKAAIEIKPVSAQDGVKVERQNGKTAMKRELHQTLALKRLRKRMVVRVSVSDAVEKDVKSVKLQSAEEKASQGAVKLKKSHRSLKFEVPRSSRLQEEPFTSNESKGQVGLKNERDTAVRPMRTGSARLHEALLSRYEDSVKSVEIKSNYQNIKNADGNFEEIVRQFTLLMRKGGGEAKVLLQPEHLGNVKLRIQLDRGEVATSIIVDNQTVRDLILSRLNILEESLLEHGFNLGSFEVGVKGENAGDEAAAETARGNPNTDTVDGMSGVENETLTENVVGQLPWISTRVNVTV